MQMPQHKRKSRKASAVRQAVLDFPEFDDKQIAKVIMTRHFGLWPDLKAAEASVRNVRGWQPTKWPRTAVNKS